MAEALAFAHAQGILHRDLKPSNLLLDPEGRVWLTDFGLAKDAGDIDNLTSSGFLIGTLRYMPPERFQGHSDVRGDIYGLGITLYELFTLRAAYVESDRTKLLHQIIHQEPPPPRKLNPDVPRDLETIVLKASARDPQRRYQTAEELATDLRHFVDDKPIRARRASELEKLWRWCRRNPALATLAAAFLLTLILGSAGIAWKWWEAEGEKQKVILAERQTAGERDQATIARVPPSGPTQASRGFGAEHVGSGHGPGRARRGGRGPVPHARRPAPAGPGPRADTLDPDQPGRLDEPDFRFTPYHRPAAVYQPVSVQPGRLVFSNGVRRRSALGNHHGPAGESAVATQRVRRPSAQTGNGLWQLETRGLQNREFSGAGIWPRVGRWVRRLRCRGPFPPWLLPRMAPK